MPRPLAHCLLLALAQPAVVFAQTTIAVSVDSFGNQPQGSSGSIGGPAISAEGRHVVFDSQASLTSQGGGLFDHDRLSGQTIRIAGSLSHSPSISADGRFVVFENSGHLYIWDRQSASYEAVNVSSNGTPASIPWQYGRPSVSDDGRFVAFNSGAPNLDPNDNYSGDDVFLRDRLAGTTHVLSTDGLGGYEATISSNGEWVVFVGVADPVRLRLWNRTLDATSVIDPGVPGGGVVQFPKVSDDGRFIVFNRPQIGDVFLLDRQTSSLTLISAAGINAQLSPDARFVTYVGPGSRSFLLDRQLGTTECVSLSWTGMESNGERPATTPDGRFTAFRSYTSNMVPNQTNQEPGMFLRDRQAVPEVVTFCLGDGSAAACPCGNTVPAGTIAGCMNSTGTGASLSATGTASISADTVVLTTVGMPDSFSLYVRGAGRANGGQGTAFGDGLRCLGGIQERLGLRSITRGTSSLGGQLSAHGALAGVSQHFQTWYRNPVPAFCAPGTFNLSNGLTILWGP